MIFEWELFKRYFKSWWDSHGQMKNVTFDIGWLNCEYMTYIFTEFNKSSRSQIFFNVAIIKNFAIHTEKHLKGWRSATYQKETPTQVCSCGWCTILRTAFLENNFDGCFCFFRIFGFSDYRAFHEYKMLKKEYWIQTQYH